ncbi:hypothetical protein D3C73_694470 [compost metagenome]
MFSVPVPGARRKSPFQLVQHCLNPRLTVGLQNIVKRFNLKSLGGVLLIRSNEHNVRLNREPADILGEQHTVNGRDINIQKNNIDLFGLKILQRIQPVFKLRSNPNTAVRSDQISKLLSGQHFILNNYRSHRCSFMTSK